MHLPPLTKESNPDMHGWLDLPYQPANYSIPRNTTQARTRIVQIKLCLHLVVTVFSKEMPKMF